MKVKTIAGAVIGLLAMGLVSAVLFPAGRPQYRLGERLHAQSQFRQDPSETNRKAVIEEYSRLHKHEQLKGLTSFAVSFTLYVLFVHHLWRQEKEREKA